MKPEDIIQAYNTEGSIKKVAALFRISEQKVRKILIDAGEYESDMSMQVKDLYRQGFSVEDIADKLGVSKSAVSGYLPYSKGLYLGENPSSNAIKIRKCRAKNSDSRIDSRFHTWYNNNEKVYRKRQSHTVGAFLMLLIFPFLYLLCESPVWHAGQNAWAVH